MNETHLNNVPMKNISEIDLFHFDEDYLSFEDFSHTNGIRYWYARDLMKMLGYESFDSFRKAINKATSACLALNIDIADNFIQANREIDGQKVRDFRLSRFACYMTVMNGDAKKPRVAEAQVYFATLAATFQKYFQEAEDVERIIIRDEISENEKTLNSTAMSAGVVNFSFFQSKGYRGLYNMTLLELKSRKGIPEKRSPLDFMGKEELAANLFRITQTEAKIKSDGTYGQRELEATAYHVGRHVRQTMKDISGTRPEDLPVAQDIKRVHSNIKAAHRGLHRTDKLPD